MTSFAAPPDALATLPRCRLAPLPSPLTRAPRLGGAIGLPDLWLKRDDCIAFGFGGNKVRGLEFLIADALARKADVILTGAGTPSNHVRATAAAAAWANLDAIAVYWGSEPARADGNFALTRFLGAQTRFTGSTDRASVDAALDVLAPELRAAGRRPYVIPRGGACALGVVGHVAAVAELAAQCRAAGVTPSTIALSVGSGGTFAGWLLGIRLLQLPWRLAGFTVSRPAAETRARIVTLANEAARLAALDLHVAAGDIMFANEAAMCAQGDDTASRATLDDRFLGDGYGVPTADGQRAIALAARREGVFFDPTYTAKAFAGVTVHAAEARIGAGETVIFLHTGGQPTLLASLEGRV